jgi:hypothetical protein
LGGKAFAHFVDPILEFCPAISLFGAIGADCRLNIRITILLGLDRA